MFWILIYVCYLYVFILRNVDIFVFIDIFCYVYWFFRGYVILFLDNGIVVWYGDVLRRFMLFIMDIYGDVIGIDGYNFVMFEFDGKIVKL